MSNYTSTLKWTHLQSHVIKVSPISTSLDVTQEPSCDYAPLMAHKFWADGVSVLAHQTFGTPKAVPGPISTHPGGLDPCVPSLQGP